MKRFALLPALFAGVCLILTAPAKADDGAIQLLADSLKPFVHELAEPVTVFHWFSGTNRNAVWTTAMSSDSPSGWDHVQSMSRVYFQGYCTGQPGDAPDCDPVPIRFGLSNMMGPGFYAAFDPVMTASYGQNTNWVLLQIRLPKGFRILDTIQIQGLSVPQDVRSALQGLGCNIYYSLAEIVASSAYNRGRNTCLQAVRAILKDELKLDAFVYPYNAFPFTECKAAARTSAGLSPHQGAFVISNGSLIKPEDVKVFNSKSTDDVETRVRITSFFYKADAESGYATPSSVQAGQPALITSQNRPKTMPRFDGNYNYYNNSPSPMLWTDLEGKPQDTNLGQWLLDNSYACSGKLPY